MSPSYTPHELMVVAAAREIADGEIVFVGMRLPLLAFGLAKRTHAPTAIGLFENGLVRDRVPPPDLYTMSDAPNVAGAAWATGLLDVMHVLQRGDVDLGFIGGAEVDRFGNINTNVIGSPERPQLKLPGSGGGADIACLAQRLASLHPFTTPAEVQAATGWPLRVAEDCSPTSAPTADELRLIREADPHGFWT